MIALAKNLGSRFEVLVWRSRSLRCICSQPLLVGLQHIAEPSNVTSNMSADSSIITKLRALRLLPPPANELVPLLFAIATFSCATLIFGHDHLQEVWVSMLQLYPPENLFVFGTFAVYMTMYWGYSCIIHTADHTIPALHHFKIQPKIKVAPWSDVLRMVPLVLFNQVGLGLPLLKVVFLILTWRGRGSPEAMTEFATQVPSIGRFLLTMVANVLCTEIWFYSMHRTLHSNTLLYRWIHKLHHSYKTPSCLESAYVHPIEFMLNSFTVLLIGPLVTGAPLILYIVFSHVFECLNKELMYY